MKMMDEIDSNLLAAPSATDFMTSTPAVHRSIPPKKKTVRFHRFSTRARGSTDEDRSGPCKISFQSATTLTAQMFVSGRVLIGSSKVVLLLRGGSGHVVREALINYPIKKI